jgi:hypothetical protein
MTLLKSKLVLFATLLALATVTSACEDAAAPEETPVASLQLTVGTQTVTLIKTGASGTLIVSGASSNVTVKAFDADGGEIQLEPDDFELRLTPTNASLLTFVHVTGTTGKLNRTASGTTSLAVVLYHTAANETDFGPVNVTVTVQ